MNEIGAAVDAAAAKVGGPPAVMNGGVPALLQRQRSLFTRCSLVSACGGPCSAGDAFVQARTGPPGAFRGWSACRNGLGLWEGVVGLFWD